MQNMPLTDDSYNVTPEELFDLFGKFGPVRYVTNPHLLTVQINEYDSRKVWLISASSADKSVRVLLATPKARHLLSTRM